MAQQINLYSPILLTPKRYFSALAMARALGAFAVGLAALCAWSAYGTVSLRRDLQAATQSHDVERQRLKTTLAQRPAAALPAALEQELAQERKQLSERQRLLEALTRGIASEGHGHSAWLRLLAQTVPAPVWLTEVRLAEGRVELSGLTLEPAALRPWLAQLSAHPLAAGHSFDAVKVERSAAAGQPGPTTVAGADSWTFQVGGGPAPGSTP